MRTLNLSLWIFLSSTIAWSTITDAASTLYCEVDDANISFGLKAISHRVTATTERFDLQLKADKLSLTGQNPQDSQHFVIMIDNLDELRMKAQFREPEFTFEAYMAHAGNRDDAISWNGAYKVTHLDQSNQAPLRGMISCLDGY